MGNASSNPINWYRAQYAETDEIKKRRQLILAKSCHPDLHDGAHDEWIKLHSYYGVDKQSMPVNIKQPIPMPPGPTAVRAMKNDNFHPIISKALVVCICIEQYDGDQLENLKFGHINKTNMKQLFVDRYNYHYITNKNKTCTLSEYKNIIRKSQTEFSEGTADYQCIIMIFSGHGSENKLYFSDYDVRYGPYNYIDRAEFESCFDGKKVKNKIAAYKIFFVDACRGNEHAKYIESDLKIDDDFDAAQPKGTKGGHYTFHPDARRILFYPNTANYASYDEPSNGGILLYSLYSVMMDDKNYNKNFLEIQDLMKRKTNHRHIDVKQADGTISKHPVLIVTSTEMEYGEMMKIYFKKNETKKDATFLMQNKLNARNNVLFM